MPWRRIGEMDVSAIQLETITVSNMDICLPFANIKKNRQKWLLRLKQHHFRGDDVKEPPASGGFREIDNSVCQQEMLVNTVAMPFFRANERGEI